MVRSIVTAATVALAVAALAGGCRGADGTPSPGRSPSAEPVTSPTVAPVGGPVPFRVRLAAGQRLIQRSSAPGGCPGLDTVVTLGSGRVRFIAYATSCPADDRQDLINGRHGTYRTLADVPAERRAGAITVQTALGEATAFVQPYSEYTNSANHYTEPVAVITLATPVDPAYQTLIAVSEKGTLPLDQLTAVLREQLLAP